MREAKAGDILSSETACLDMICTDEQGDKVVIDSFVDHKKCVIGDWNEHTQNFSFHGDTARYDELTFTGETYVPPPAKVISGPSM